MVNQNQLNKRLVINNMVSGPDIKVWFLITGFQISSGEHRGEYYQSSSTYFDFLADIIIKTQWRALIFTGGYQKRYVSSSE